MWRVYLILAVWTQSSNAQQSAITPNARGGEGAGGNIYSEYNYNTHLTSGSNNNNNNNPLTHTPQLPALPLNTSSRDSFVYTPAVLSHKQGTDFSRPQQNQNIHNKNKLATKSPQIIFIDDDDDDHHDFLSTKPSTVWKIQSKANFNEKLYEVMFAKAQYENLVYSPIALQTILAFIFTMSEGKLFEELAHLLAISNDPAHVASVFENILQTAALNAPPTILVMANKLYYDYRFGPLDHSVRNFAKKSFDCEMEQIDFFASKKAANIINSWVSEKTHNLIQDIVAPAAIGGDTSALLLNSIYFKGEWMTKFDTLDTEIQEFFLTEQSKVPVQMMYNEDVFRYGDFAADLQASAVELPYKASNLSMLLILPQQIGGLEALERKLRYYDFQTISERLKREIVTVKLPRFEVEYEIDMIRQLQRMGLNALFNNVGSINLFKNQQKPFKIDQFKHKSFIKVNEAGTEAAAATVAKYVPLSIQTDMKYFVADHPFVFVIRDANTTFFIGHVVKF